MFVADLTVELLNPSTGRHSRVLEGASLHLKTGQVMGVTGPSGSGKSTLASALAGMLPNAARVMLKTCELGAFKASNSREVVAGDVWSERVRAGWGTSMFLISQDARSTLFPNRTIEWHLRRADAVARRVQPRLTQWRPEQALAEVGFQKPESFLNRLPGSLSTGQCQRVQWAMASRLPIQWLIADEPFASVDDTRAIQLANQIRDFAGQGRGVLLISHQLELLQRVSDSMLVVNQGCITAHGPVAQILTTTSPTVAAPRIVFKNASPPSSETHTPCILKAENLTKEFGSSKRWIKWGAAASKSPPRANVVFKNRCLAVPIGSRFGLMGESGHGKTTFARIAMGLAAATAGTIERLPATPDSAPGMLDPEQCHELWRHFQMVHQDTDLIFDPSSRLGDVLVQVIQAGQPDLDDTAAWQLAGRSLLRFGLSAEVMLSPATRLSGGEKRRAAIARCLLTLGVNRDTGPLSSADSGGHRLLILDEPTVGLDSFWQQVVRDELLEVQRQFGLTYFVISHDPRFVSQFCDPQHIEEWR